MDRLVVLAGVALVVASCSRESAPVRPTDLHAGHDQPSAVAAEPAVAAASGASQGHGHQDKGFIDGWVNGRDVQLYYTMSYFCAEPPDSAAWTGCQIGAPAEIAPRPGPIIPAIYAIAAAGGIQPDLSTLACPPGSVCLNHPAMIDASRIAGPRAASIPGVPHSHIVTSRQGGWHRTINIRVTDLAVWNDIAGAKSLARVRELQADAMVGGLGKISADTPTNVYFFIASWR